MTELVSYLTAAAMLAAAILYVYEARRLRAQRKVLEAEYAAVQELHKGCEANWRRLENLRAEIVAVSMPMAKSPESRVVQ